eukprot:gene36149-44585_t
MTNLLGAFDVWRYASANTLFYGAGGSELKIIDPVTFEIKADMFLTERCSFARMSMVAVENEKGEAEDAIVLLGDENIYQFRWNTVSQELFKVPVWTREDRRKFEGE